ncbi:suppressor of fused domain protein [Photobacterium sp. GJ3]|uniref:suppressor of fused domain protein n=1 Tax=Photobacterium sp. GJ3 TaxID=2829502 RepID=UPI001B8BFD42|nr:suppressor of fused domain protein [Photobacterium sp. GJ3]QUJ67387.1 suppressor of fused domain protein [Photobacterium sp. GJ3]
MLIKHMEKHLGLIIQGWKDNNSNYKVLLFNDTPVENVSTYVSLGLSEHSYCIGYENKVKQELLFSCNSSVDPEIISSLLMSLCESVSESKKAVLRGEVVLLPEEITQRLGFQAIYFTMPAYFDEGFYEYKGSKPSTVLVWAVPVFFEEYEYIINNGWEKFEDMLEELDPDLCSIKRESLI